MLLGRALALGLALLLLPARAAGFGVLRAGLAAAALREGRPDRLGLAVAMAVLWAGL